MTHTLSLRTRVGAVALAGVVLAALAVVYTVRATDRNEPAVRTSNVTLDNTRGLYVRTAEGTVSALDNRRSKDTGLTCRRFYASGGGAICLTTRPGIPPRSEAIVLDRKLRPKRTVTFGGTPNRARVSPSGRMVSWTVFVSGDSYAGNAFSTRSGILDTKTGYLIKNVETLQLTLGKKRYSASDLNYWGITFARDDNRFYATVSTRGKTYLVEGDLNAWTARTLRENVECPSLSPDGTRLAYKKRVREGTSSPWQLHVLDLKTLRDTPLAETRSVDDQAAWLDDHTVAYALPGRTRGSSDVWSVPADGSGEPVRMARDASSPSMNFG
ncbi:TolB family protein [Streptomyces mesophilus]|uniref:TolB family protein n=1 Tax=Streptomyces mesophilus TaxID=1775132 RepID=UPI00331EBD20